MLLLEQLQLLNFIEENKKAGGLVDQQRDLLSELVDKYKKQPEKGDSIITADFGLLGSVIVRNITEIEEDSILKYEPGSYDYISIQYSKIRKILWTDYNDTEPYNRQSGLYCDGATFDWLGKPVKELEDYREFDKSVDANCNLSFGIWGFSWNSYYKTVSFGLAIKTEDVDVFLSTLRQIIGKI